jgi:hypothetical protein
MRPDTLRETKTEYCYRCGTIPVPYSGWRCRPCQKRDKGLSFGPMWKIVLILIMTALLTLAARWAFAVRETISAESIGASHSE